MASLTDSSIQSWLTFDGTLPPTIQPCRFVDHSSASVYSPTYPITDCSNVCNDSISLFEPTNNDTLVTCGLWTTLVSSTTSTSDELGNYLLPPNDTQSLNLLKAFNSVGLDLDMVQYTQSYAHTISDCLVEIYSDVKEFSFADDGTMPANCSENDIFPFGTNASSSWNDNVESLNTCMNLICSPVTLNPDLAGIGVFSSFVIQSSIAVLALAALIILELLSPRSKTSNPDDSIKPDKPLIELLHRVEQHICNLITALVEFHKAQCYFASTIQITALILYHQSHSYQTDWYNSNEPIFDKDLIDSDVLLLLATSASVPICVVLACITRYGRHSWYVIILSTITVLLATATMGSAAATFWFEINIKESPWNPNVDDASISTPSCTIYASSAFVPPLCGHSKLSKNFLPSGDTISNHWIWAVWANCIIWLLYCITEKLLSLKRYKPFRARTAARFRRSKFVVSLRGTCHKFPLWALIYVVPWSLCFAAQIILFTVFVEHYFIPYDWTLGQIIAVVVWVPSVIEYIYIAFNGVEEAAVYRYPHQYHLRRYPGRSSREEKLRSSSSSLSSMELQLLTFKPAQGPYPARLS